MVSTNSSGDMRDTTEGGISGPLRRLKLNRNSAAAKRICAAAASTGGLARYAPRLTRSPWKYSSQYTEVREEQQATELSRSCRLSAVRMPLLVRGSAAAHQIT